MGAPLSMSELTENEERELLGKIEQGDEAALEELLTHLQPKLYRFSLKMCRHEEDAEDVLQESMLAFVRSLRNFKGTSRLSTYLYSIARNACIKKRRTSKFAPKEVLSLNEEGPLTASLASPNKNPSQDTENKETWELVKDAIAAMEPAYKEVLILRDIEGLSAAEVATVTDLSIPAVKSRLHRARAQLRAAINRGPYQIPEGCPDVRQLFSEFLEDDLSPKLCETMQEHVEVCEHCANECQGLKHIVHVCQTAPTTVPPNAARHLRDAIAEALTS